MELSNTQVIILAGGRGTRLSEETVIKPKPMVEIGTMPMLWHIMKVYSIFGFNRFVIAAGYKGGLIKDFFLNYAYQRSHLEIRLGADHPEVRVLSGGQGAEKWEVRVIETGEDAMTGSRVAQCLKFVDSPHFCVTYGDGLTNCDLKAEYDFHVKHGKVGTVLAVRPRARFGELTFSSDQNLVSKFFEKPLASSGFINGGFFIFKKEFASYLSSEEDCILEKNPLEKLAGDGQLMAYRHEGFWRCMDTLRDKTELNEFWESGKAEWKNW